jgi:predicted secreted protein
MIDFNPFAFSTDDKYFAFAKDVFQNEGGDVWWISYLYVVDIETKQLTYIGKGKAPLWNPSMPH